MHFATIRVRGRAVALALFSLSVVLLAVMYVLAPTQPRMDMSVRDTGAVTTELTAAGHLTGAALRSAGPRTAALCRGAATEVIYGSIKAARGSQFKTATIAFLTPRKRTCVTIFHRKTGVYRATVRLRGGRTYILRVTVHVGGQTVADTRMIRIRAHHAYRISLDVRSASLFAFLPITSY